MQDQQHNYMKLKNRSYKKDLRLTLPLVAAKEEEKHRTENLQFLLHI